ncbi:hypothetical protein [Caldisericum sp.]|uniref:hypothetical protein n=1 Tax=Caldisericum sp. TaxID=2499687 RepID=UPI003D14C364
MPRKKKAFDIISAQKKDDDSITELLKNESVRGFLSKYSVTNPIYKQGRLATIALKSPAMILEILGEFDILTKGKRKIPIQNDIRLYNLAHLAKQKNLTLDEILLTLDDIRKLLLKKKSL